MASAMEGRVLRELKEATGFFNLYLKNVIAWGSSEALLRGIEIPGDNIIFLRDLRVWVLYRLSPAKVGQ